MDLKREQSPETSNGAYQYPERDMKIKYFMCGLMHLLDTSQLQKEITKNWESWWKDNTETNLVQFIGKDNILFHTVVFPAVELGSKENWTMLNKMSSREDLNYENLKFSKSAGTGIFGNDAITTGIPADVWRFYIYYNRPEQSDFQFMWDDLFERTNTELIGIFSNLINRVLAFYKKFLETK